MLLRWLDRLVNFSLDIMSQQQKYSSDTEEDDSYLLFDLPEKGE